MSVNFPLFLVMATGVSGFIWLVDVFMLRPKRVLAAASVTEKIESRGKEAVEKLLKEPVVVEYAISFFPILLIVLVLRSFLAEPFQIPTGSMIPTLKVGDFILVNKFSYGLRLPAIGTKIVDVNTPKNGEVMVFIPPHKDEYFIKRIVGIPGDRIRYVDKKLYINGELQPQKFIAQIPGRYNKAPYKVMEETLGGVKHLIHVNNRRELNNQEWVVPEAKYFMMGDNRDESSDSRYWGFVSEEEIVGQAFAVWLHKEPGLKLPDFSHNGWIE